MRGVSHWAVAVRQPTEAQMEKGRLDVGEGAEGEIEVQTFPLVSWTKRHRVLRWPVVRGVVALGQSLKIGFRGAEHLRQRPAGTGRGRQAGGDRRRHLGGDRGAGAGVRDRAVLPVPVGLTNLFRDSLPNSLVFVVVEKLIRIAIFLGYLLLLSRMRELRRVFEYHGAEHKTIACYEAGRAAHARERRALLAPAPPLRHQLPADRDDRGHLRVRAPGHPGVVLAVRLAGGRHPAGGGPGVRGDQVVRAQPQPPLGADPDVRPGCSCSA